MARTQSKELAHETLDNAKAALEAANSAAANARNLFIGFLALTAYVAVIIASTTHEQILRETPVTLPLLNVELPLSGFYRYLPWLYGALHFNLLLTLALMAGKVREVLNYREALIPAGEWRPLSKRLIGFPVVQVLAGEQDGFLHLLLALMIWITLVLVPLGILLWLLIGYLPAQDESVLAWQRAALTLDALVLLALWPRLMSGEGTARWWGRNLQGVGNFIAWLVLILWFDLLYVLYRRVRSGRWVTTPTLRRYMGGMMRYLAVLRRVLERHGTAHRFDPATATATSLTGLSHRLLRFRRHYAEATLLLGSALLVTAVGWFAAVIPGSDWEQRLLTLCERDYFQPLADDPCRWWPTWVLFDWERRDGDELLNRAWFRRTLNLAEAELAGAELTPEQVAAFRADNEAAAERLPSIAPLDLKGSLLRYANLERALLPKVDLRKAQLQGADLGNAQLQGARFDLTDLQGADLGNAQLQGADLGNAQLQGADLRGANLSEVDLSRAELRGVNLPGAQLQGINLKGRDLQGANLRVAQLQGADLRVAQLQGADLGNAQLQDADLRGAHLSGADLGGADLSGANLGGAKLRRVNLSGAQLQGVNLKELDLQSADLSSAELQGADLSSAELQGADLSGANLSGANLGGVKFGRGKRPRVQLQAGAQLQGARLDLADLTGANLNGAELQGATLTLTDLRGADLRDANLSGVDLSGVYPHGPDLSGLLSGLGGANLSGADLRSTTIDRKSLSYSIVWEATIGVFSLEDYNELEKSMASDREGNPRLEAALERLKTLAQAQTPTRFEGVVVEPSGSCLVDESLKEVLPECLVGEANFGRYLGGALPYLVDLGCYEQPVLRGLIDRIIGFAEEASQAQASVREALLRLQECAGFEPLKAEYSERLQAVIEQLQAIPEPAD